MNKFNEEKKVKPQTPNVYVMGKIYLKKDDVWAIDYTHKDFVQVYIREEVFKCKPEDLVLVD